MAEVAKAVLLKAMAASATASCSIALNALTQQVIITVAAQYGTVAATTGVQVQLSVSYNNGSTYTTSAQSAIIVPGATSLQQSNIVYRMGEDPFSPDQGCPTNIEVALTNEDATNTATVSVIAQALSHQA